MSTNSVALRVAKISSPLFLVGYCFALVPSSRSIGSALILPGLAVLIIAGWQNASAASRIYFGITVVLASASIAMAPFDGRLLAESVTSLATVIGLVVVLRTIGFPILANRYRRAIDQALARMRRRRMRDDFTAALVGLGLGQLLAYAVVPLADQILGVDKESDSHRTSRWTGRGLSVTVLSAVAFPTVSIAVDLLDISVTSYLVYSIPLTLFCGAVLLVRARGQAESVARTDPPSEAPIGTPDDHPVSVRPLWEVLGYLLALILTVIVLSSVLEAVSYLGIVSFAGLVSSLVTCFALAGHGEAAPLTALGRYSRDWWRHTGPEVYVFAGGGFLLYFFTQAGLLESLPNIVLTFAASLGLPDLVYVIFSTLVFALFMVGVHPTVSVLMISLAVATPGAVDNSVSMPLMALALMVGNAAALMPSPFSALSMIRAAMTGTDVFRVIGENLKFGLALFIAGNLFVLLGVELRHT